MLVFFDKDDFVAELARLGVGAIDQAGIGNVTGTLRNTLIVEETPDGYTMIFEPYGLYLDAGVQGTQRGFSGQGYSGQVFKFSGQYKMIGGTLGGQGPGGYAIRTAIYRDGIAARPWIENALNLIAERAADLIENEVVVRVEERVTSEIPDASVRVTL